MIQSFADPEAELIWSGRRSRRLPTDIQNVAFERRLNQVRLLNASRIPPGNRAIRDRWRSCFGWDDGGPTNVEIVDDLG